MASQQFPDWGEGGGGGILQFANVAAFPAVGNTSFLYIDESTNTAYYWNGTNYVSLGSGTGTYFRGTYNASSNNFPTVGGSGVSGVIQAGDTWVITTPGTLGSYTYQIGDYITAKVANPGQTESNWSSNAMFVSDNINIIDPNGSDILAPRFPNETIAGAMITNPPPYTYALNPGSYDTVTSFNNLSIIGIDDSKTYLSCTTNSINITDGNMITNIENLTILKTATAGDAVKLSGNIGTVNFNKVVFQVLTGSGSDINLNAVTGGTLNLFDCTFTDEANLQLRIMASTTACNINVYNAVGNLIFSSDGKVNAYVENSTIGTANHNGGVFDIQTSDLLGIISPALATDPGNALYFSNCDSFQTDNGAFTAILMQGGCKVVINNSNFDYNTCVFGITPQYTTILQDTNRVRVVNNATLIKNITIQDNTFVIDGSSGGVLLAFFDTTNTSGLMSIRNFKFIRIDNSSNLVQIQTTGGTDRFIGNYVGSNELSTIAADTTVNVQVNFKTHQLLIY